MIEYFYILTISWNIGYNMNIRTRSGIATADEGQSQESIYTRLYEDTREFFNAPEATGVTYYYLARNET